MNTRIVPVLPPVTQTLRLLIDSDAGTEIDDLYAVALALKAPKRFRLEGFVATHFAQRAGRESIQQSYDVLQQVLSMAGLADRYPVAKGGAPLAFRNEPVDSPGAQLIIARAHGGSAEDPLWVVAIGAASNVASALLLDPSIKSKVRIVFHARSELSWPQRSEQYNVAGDIRAAQCLLESDVPLVWFDTGQQLTCPMDVTAEKLLALGGLPAFLHQYRLRKLWYQAADKGFFDLGDIAWMMQPEVCVNTVIDTPRLDWLMRFEHKGELGQMLRVHDIKPEPVWKLFFERMAS